MGPRKRLFLATLAAVVGCADDGGTSMLDGSGPGSTGSGGETQPSGDSTTGSGDSSPSDSDPSDSDDTGVGSANCPDPGGEAPVDGLQHLGRAQYGASGSFLEILDVVADGTVIYQCTATQGLMIYDASADGPPALGPEKVGGPFAHPQFPRCQHVGADFANDRLVITSRGDEVQPEPFFYMFDISDPGSPVALTGWQGDASIEGVVLDGSRVYAATHDDGIIVFEDQGGPQFVQTAAFADGSSDAWQPVLVGDTLVVAEGATGLRLYDVSTGTPELLSTVALGGSSKDVIVLDDVAYLAASSSIAAVDIADPANPTILAERDVLGTALALAMGQNETLLVAEWDELRGYDASDPSVLQPVLSETVPTTGAFSRVLTVDAVPVEPGGVGRAYAGEWEGMHAYDQVDCAYGPEIWLTPTAMQFGVVDPGDQDTQVLVIRNNGNQALSVSSIGATSPDLIFDVSAVDVAAGQAAAVEVTFAPGSTAQFDGEISITSNDLDESDKRLRIAGNVVGLGVGDPAPPINLFDLDGEQWSNADLEGNVAVLAYFATF